jgi:hypothetical protein
MFEKLKLTDRIVSGRTAASIIKLKSFLDAAGIRLAPSRRELAAAKSKGPR